RRGERVARSSGARAHLRHRAGMDRHCRRWSSSWRSSAPLLSLPLEVRLEFDELDPTLARRIGGEGGGLHEGDRFGVFELTERGVEDLQQGADEGVAARRV